MRIADRTNLQRWIPAEHRPIAHDAGPMHATTSYLGAHDGETGKVPAAGACAGIGIEPKRANEMPPVAGCQPLIDASAPAHG